MDEVPKKIVLVIFILLVVTSISILINYFDNKSLTIPKEGFETYLENVQDRGNILAAGTNPVKNTIVPIGISESKANILREQAKVALNNPVAIAETNGGTRYVESKSLITPRIDSENDFLGKVKFCKEKGQESSGNPFADPKFAADCGMCMSSGSLITGEVFTKPTGVLVYQADKINAFFKKNLNKDDFARAIPSMNAAICKNASLDSTGLPVLALTSEDYELFKKRLACQHGGSLGGGCAICQKSGQFSYVDNADPITPLTLILYGNGQVTVSISGKIFSANQELSDTTPLQVELGRLKEGTPFTVRVVQSKSKNGPYIFGALLSNSQNDAPYAISLNRVVLKDATTGSTPKTSTARIFPGIPENLTRIIPAGTNTRIELQGLIPLTFVQKGVLAAYDCKSGPYLKEQASADLLARGPCFTPKGQGPGKYSRDCLQSIVLQASAIVDGQEVSPTSNGEWFKSPEKFVGNRSAVQFLEWMNSQIPKVFTDITTSKNVTGKDISTPCDPFLGTRQTPDQKCMIYLYKNEGQKNRRVGSSYTGRISRTVLQGDKILFCRPEGTLNPETQNGMGELTLQSRNGYKGKFGIEAIKQYLNDIFERANSNLDVTIPDSQGGKRDSWSRCINLPIAPPAPQQDVRKNASGGVSDTTNCISLFPKSFTPRANTKLLSSFSMPANYRISFTFLIKQSTNNWTNILHFTKGNNSGQFGDRSPAIFVVPNTTRLHVRIGDSKDGNWGFDTDGLPHNQQIPITLTCQGSSVSMIIGSIQTINVTQPSFRYAGNVTVWGSDPWYPATPCEITNFCFTGL